MFVILSSWLVACGGSNIHSGGQLTTTLTGAEEPALSGSFTLAGSAEMSGDPDGDSTPCDGEPTQSAGWVFDNRADAWPAYSVRACGPVTLDGDYVQDAELDVWVSLSAPPAEGESRGFVEAGGSLSWELQLAETDGGARWGGRVQMPTAGLDELLAGSSVRIDSAGSGSLSLPEVPWEWRENCSSAVQNCGGDVTVEIAWEMED